MLSGSMNLEKVGRDLHRAKIKRATGKKTETAQSRLIRSSFVSLTIANGQKVRNAAVLNSQKTNKKLFRWLQLSARCTIDKGNQSDARPNVETLTARSDLRKVRTGFISCPSYYSMAQSHRLETCRWQCGSFRLLDWFF